MTYFITDMGRDVAYHDQRTGETSKLPRFAIWVKRKDETKPVVLEVSFDLRALRAQYGSDVPVYRIDELRTNER